MTDPDELHDRFRAAHLPPYMWDAVHRYVVHRQPVGHFLSALLQNDLRATLAHADATNTAALTRWAAFVHHDLPAVCHGSPQRVSDWTKGPPSHAR